LRKEGEISLRVFLDMCAEDSVDPRKDYSGKFNIRIPKQLHKKLAQAAAASGKSLNNQVADILDENIDLQ
jgi:predicted HicB family RNase H-like nuclease